MATKVRELDNRRDGDRNACRLCHPADPRKFVRADQVWRFALAHPNERVWRDAPNPT
ncbi:MAG TPA: hypothetical protein VHD87_15180 [Acidimicrobiales bacterium]|nr:hypothetical protein [Acidimicrobiales bacterium]